MVTGKHIDSLRQRFGLFSPNTSRQHPQRIWFHAASVGEVQVAKALISECIRTKLDADYIVTSVTEQGQFVAHSQLGNIAQCLYAPVDLPWVIRSFLRKLGPTAYVCLETELWPNMLRIAHENRVKTILLNGRMSEKSFNLYKRFVFFFNQVINSLDLLSVISDTDKRRYAGLGYPSDKITVTGNAKYVLREWVKGGNSHQSTQLQSPDTSRNIIQHYRQLLGLVKSSPVLIAGSTHTGEEQILSALHAELAKRIPGLILIIAPRHLEKLDQVRKTLKASKVEFQDFSTLRLGTPRKAPVILLDVMGELSTLYAIGTYVFCGGSLVPRGGHNIVEPAIQGKAPIYGPHMNDFLDAVSLLEGEKAGFAVANAEELQQRIYYLYEHPDELTQANQRAQSIAFRQQDSAHKQIDLLTRILHH